jgi:hypothetical protein
MWHPDDGALTSLERGIVRLAEPPGVRSCRDGGKWEMGRDRSGNQRFVGDLDRLKASMPESARANWLQDIHTRMKRAERGQCTFGPTSSHDVDQMACAPIVLELRMSDYFGRNPEDPDGDPHERHTRLYFTEPEHSSGQLLLLGVMSKCPGPVGLEEQNKAAVQAKNRAFEHFERQ